MSTGSPPRKKAKRRGSQPRPAPAPRRVGTRQPKAGQASRAVPRAAAQLVAARVVKLDDVASGDPDAQPDNPQYARRFLGEGDSWFSYNAVPHSANVLDQIHLPAPCVVFTLAQPGDTIRHMGRIASNPMLRRYLADRNFASNWDAILLSGGGNDLIDAVQGIIVAGAGTAPGNWINETALADTLNTVAQGYEAIVAARDAPGSPSAGKPIVVHTYDYPTPNNTPATFLGLPAVGPWFWKRFESLEVADPRLRALITDYVLDRLAETLLGLAERFANFRVVDTRGTLARAAFGATGNSNDWLNEIHPNSAGYRKIADRICAALSNIP